MTNEQARIKILEATSHAWAMIRNIARTDPNITGFRTRESLVQEIAQLQRKIEKTIVEVEKELDKNPEPE